MQATAHPLTERLVDCARTARLSGKGKRMEVYATYAKEFGWLRPDGTPNVKRLLGVLRKSGLHSKRAQRSDRGLHSLPQLEAEEIVRWQRENARANNKGLVCLEDAVAALRSNGHIKAEAVDPSTGVVTPLSISAIRDAIRSYGLSADVLDTPPPAMRMRVLHANHVWEVDASMCVLYYLPRDGGLQAMEEMLYNSNKPKNMKRIENERVWRYVVTDVASGCLYVEYVFGGESGANLSQIFINAMQERPGEFWGVPEVVYCDAGSANTGIVFKGLCGQLGINLIWHMPGAARATGAVEKGQDIVECKFESMLASRRIFSLEDVNAAARDWCVKFNQTAVMSRHGLPRYLAWCRFVAGQLVEPPSLEVCRQLVGAKLESRKVTQYMTIEFEGQHWDASGYPGAYRGMKVNVCRNPWEEKTIRIALAQRDGEVQYYLAPVKETNEMGYWIESPVLGESFASHAQTPPEAALKRLAERTAADQPVGAAKRAKPMPFGGKVNPFKPLQDTYVPEFLPRKANAVSAVVTPLHPDSMAHCTLLSATQAMLRLVDGIGRNLTPDEYTFLSARCADGVPEDQIQALIDQFLKPMQAPVKAAGGLRRVA